MARNFSQKASKMFTTRKLILLFASACVAIGAGSSALAQSSGSSSAGAVPGLSVPIASGAKPTKAERKAARKEAREKKNAELKKLEQSGYQPGRDTMSYPEDVQNAQKKAGAGNAASR